MIILKVPIPSLWLLHDEHEQICCVMIVLLIFKCTCFWALVTNFREVITMYDTFALRKQVNLQITFDPSS